MRMQTQSGILLPARPRAPDWTYAGTSAGAILGISELLASYPAGSPPPPPIALLIIATNALVVGVLSSLLGVALRTSEKRISHSGMVGATLGPLLGAAIAGTTWQYATLAEIPTVLALSGLATALMLAAAVSLATMRLGESLERGGLSLSGPFVWFTAALSIASAERILWSDTRTAIAIAGLVGIPFLAATIAMARFEWVRRRGSRPPRSFSRIFALLVFGAVAAAFLPWATPWVLSDLELPALDEQGPPNILVVALGSASASAAIGSEPRLGLLASSSVSYENVQPDGPSGVRELLTTPTGASVPSELAANGYAAATIFTDPERASTLEGVEIDSAPGAQRLLTESFGWMAGASLLTGPGAPLLAAWGLGATYRTPDQIAAAAKRWLTSWRMRRAPAPFFLYVDFGATDGLDRRDTAEAGLLDLLEQLEQLDVDHRTAVVVASDPHARRSADSGPPAPFTAVLRPAAGWPQSARGVRVHRKIDSREIGAALLAMADRNPSAVPRALPGQSNDVR
jgi:hypothetical protein